VEPPKYVEQRHQLGSHEFLRFDARERFFHVRRQHVAEEARSPFACRSLDVDCLAKGGAFARCQIANGASEQWAWTIHDVGRESLDFVERRVKRARSLVRPDAGPGKS
jgi:hypothetical protein